MAQSDIELDGLLDDALGALGQSEEDLDALLDEAAAELVFDAAPAAPAAAPVKQSPARTTLPVLKQLADSGVPPGVATRWCEQIQADHASQATRQRPFSRAYKAWSTKPGPTVGRRGVATAQQPPPTGVGSPQQRVPPAAAALFGDVLQKAVVRAKLADQGQTNAVVAAVHGKDANAELVAAVQKLYLRQVVRDALPRLRADPDLAEAGRHGRFPKIRKVLESTSR